MSAWITHQQACEHLGKTSKSMLALMKDAERAENGLERQWVNETPGGRRPTYFWLRRGLDDWYRRVCEWRRLQSEETATGSGGEQPTEPAPAGSSRGARGPKRSRSASTATGKRREGSVGDLRELARTLNYAK